MTPGAIESVPGCVCVCALPGGHLWIVILIQGRIYLKDLYSSYARNSLHGIKLAGVCGYFL